MAQPHGQSLAAHHVDGSFAAAFRRNLVALRAATGTSLLHRLLAGSDSPRIVMAAVRNRIAERHPRYCRISEAQMRRAYDGWRLTKFTNDAQPAAKPANGRNVPQPIEETEDVPF